MKCVDVNIDRLIAQHMRISFILDSGERIGFEANLPIDIEELSNLLKKCVETINEFKK